MSNETNPLKSPFHRIFEKAGASFIERDGALAAETVAGFEEEYRAATSAAVAIDRFHRDRIQVTGKDRELFLQNMLSNDVRKLPASSGAPATFLTPKGKLVADMLVLKEAERILLEVEASRVEPLTSALDRYIISEDVALTSLRDREASFSVEGPRAGELLAAIAGTPAKALEDLGHLQFLQVAAGGAPTRILAHHRELTPRFDLAVPTEQAVALFERVLERGAELGLVLAGEQLAETRRIEAGRPRFGIDLDESHLPLEAGLDDAISFEKGCYIGQEYVVRLAHRGHVNRKLVGLRAPEATPPPRGARVVSGEKQVGEVTSAAYSPGLEASVALAYLRRGYFEPGTEVAIEWDESRLEAKVSSLPFREHGR